MIVYTDNWQMSDDFWAERPFTFNEIKCTEYMWPKDRIVAFVDTSGANVLVPTFDLTHKDVIDDLDLHISQCISTAPAGLNVKSTEFHLHLIRVEDHPTIVGLFVDKSKRPPVLNFFTK